MVFTHQQQLADHTSKLPEETQTDARMDVYAYVKKTRQDTSIVAQSNRITKNCNSVRRMETRQTADIKS